MTTQAQAEITLADRVTTIESALSEILGLLTEAVTPNEAATPEPSTPPALTVVEGGELPPMSKPKGSKPKADSDDTEAKDRHANLDTEAGTATFKQMKALSAVTAPAPDGSRVQYLGGDGSAARKYWAFLSKQEASRAIDALKGEQRNKVWIRKPTEFTFTNGLTVQPRNPR